MLNHSVRVAAASKDVKMWEIADAMKIHESTLSKKLRRELEEAEQTRIIALINEIAERKGK